MQSPIVFIHYSWDDENHKQWVLNLADRLVKDGVDVIFDMYDLKLGSNNNYFMESVSKASKVLLIMSPSYKIKADERVAGVGYEYQIITTEFSKNLSNNDKFITVLRNGDKEISVPVIMQSYLFLDMRNDDDFESKYVELLKSIYGIPLVERPQKGEMPDFRLLGGRADVDNKLILPEFGFTREEVYEILGKPQAEYGFFETFWNHGIQVYYNKHSSTVDGFLARRQPSGVTFEGYIHNIRLGESFAEVKAKLGNPINWGLPSTHTSYAIYNIESNFLTFAIWRNTPEEKYPDFNIGSVYAIAYCEPASILACEAIITITIEEIRQGKKLSYLENEISIDGIDFTKDYFHDNYQIFPPEPGIMGGYFLKVIFIESKKELVFWLYDLAWSYLVIRGIFNSKEDES